MATIVANYAAKKLLGKQMEKYKSKKPAGDDDVSLPPTCFLQLAS
jgi:hypothetical protein